MLVCQVKTDARYTFLYGFSPVEIQKFVPGCNFVPFYPANLGFVPGDFTPIFRCICSGFYLKNRSPACTFRPGNPLWPKGSTDFSRLPGTRKTDKNCDTTYTWRGGRGTPHRGSLAFIYTFGIIVYYLVYLECLF